VFVLTGLQARTTIDRIGDLAAGELLLSAAVISTAVIVARFVWVYPATYLPRWLVPSIARDDPAPPWQSPFLIAFTGIRGIVSLAAALAIPLTIADGTPFPHRDLILFLTFCVIVVTLVGQGLALPSVIRRLGLAEIGRAERRDEMAEELASRRETIEAAARRLEELTGEREVPSEILESLRARNRERLVQLAHRMSADAVGLELVRLSETLEQQLIEAERAQLYRLLCSGRVKDEARRRIEHDLDLREAHLARAIARSDADIIES